APGAAPSPGRRGRGGRPAGRRRPRPAARRNAGPAAGKAPPRRCTPRRSRAARGRAPWATTTRRATLDGLFPARADGCGVTHVPRTPGTAHRTRSPGKVPVGGTGRREPPTGTLTPGVLSAGGRWSIGTDPGGLVCTTNTATAGIDFP